MLAAAGWEPVGPPHKQRYLQYTPAAAANGASNGAAAADGAASPSGVCLQAGQQLAQLKRDLFESGAFARLLQQLTTIQMLGHAGSVRRFRPGEVTCCGRYGDM
jgi:hypothetical protein